LPELPGSVTASGRAIESSSSASRSRDDAPKPNETVVRYRILAMPPIVTAGSGGVIARDYAAATPAVVPDLVKVDVDLVRPEPVGVNEGLGHGLHRGGAARACGVTGKSS
jgi:hypothetical protein